MIKIAFFDVDGTLLKYGHKELSKKTAIALDALQKNGVLLCMATGRSYPSIPHFNNVHFDVLLTFNGSYIRNDKEIIYKNPLNKADVRKIVDNLKKMNRPLAISNEKFIFASGTDENLLQYFAFGHEEYVVPVNFDELCKSDLYQLMCACTEQEHADILKGTSSTAITAWWDKAADIIPADSGKGKAVQTVLNYYGFSKEEAIAFGDGKNDIEMLKAVGCGVAMGNAKDEVKAEADAVCKSVEEDGIYSFCAENGLI